MRRWFVLLLLMAVSLAMPAMAAEGCYCVEPNPHQIGFDEATCTSPGYYVLECLDCGGEYRVEAKPALGHDYQYAMTNPALCESDGKEWYECTRCGDTQYQTIPKLGHQWSLAGSLNATCGKDGANYYECTRLGCGEEKTESIPATGEHDWVHTHTNRDDVECVAGGTAYYHCSVCMDQKNEPVDATGHNWQAVAATAATCQSAKVVTYKCSTCNDTKTETEGSKTDHSWVQTYYEPATCAADGYKSYKCGMCSETKTDVLPATEQCSWGDWIVATEATCTKDGLKVAQCSVCGDTKKETIPSEGVHDYRTQSSQAATCTQDGYKKYECSKCHEEKTETLKATGHNLGTATVITAATCTAEGKSEATCKTCGAKETSTIPKTAHSWGEWKVTKEATEVATGTKERTCKTCGAKDTETIPKKDAKPTATEKPTDAPTQKPTDKPTNAPTQKPTDKPTNAPTQKPTDKPTNAPTQKPTNKPTKKPAAKVSSSFEAEEGTVQVFTTAGKVNLRSGPGKDHKYVDQVPKKNTCLGLLLDAQLDKKDVVWFQVEYDGRQCWITSQYAVAVPGEYCGIIRIPDSDLTELSNIYLQSFDDVAITLGLNENMDSDIREFTNGSVFITGQHYIEHIVLTGAGYTVYGVKVGDNVTDAVRLLKQKLAPDSQSTEAYIFRIPCSPDSVSIDGEGFDGTLTITVDANKQVTSISMKANVPEAE